MGGRGGAVFELPRLLDWECEDTKWEKFYDPCHAVIHYEHAFSLFWLLYLTGSSSYSSSTATLLQDRNQEERKKLAQVAPEYKSRPRPNYGKKKNATFSPENTAKG